MHPLLQVWDAIKPNALLENVTVDPVTREPVYTDKKKTENTRVSYPLEHVPERVIDGLGDHPKNVIFLTAGTEGPRCFPFVAYA